MNNLKGQNHLGDENKDDSKTKVDPTVSSDKPH